MGTTRMHLKSVPSGYYAHYFETACPLTNQLALVHRRQYVNNTSGNFMYFLRYINGKNKSFDTMIPEKAFDLLSENLIKRPSMVEYCDIYEYMYGKDTIKVYKHNGTNIVATGEINNKEWQEDFAHYA